MNGLGPPTSLGQHATIQEANGKDKPKETDDEEKG